MSGAEALRFAGKIFGTQADYWIATGRLTSSEEELADKTAEPRGKGVNEIVFWVTDNLLNDWIQLPDCQPKHVKCARLIKHIFTGDLNANVDTNPAFDGKERHLLRATLARIFHATAIVPKGLFVKDDETEEVKFSEEFTFPKTDELKSLENWSNVHQIILQAGRTTHLPPEGVDEEGLPDAIAALEEKDPTCERFRDLAQHKPYQGEQPAWISKVVGDTHQYTEGGEGETISYAINVIRSLRWPGSVTVSKGGKCTTVYVGYGMKKGDPSYNPVEPPAVCEDPPEENEMPEPNPAKEPEPEQPKDNGDDS